jgi:hypothetical protein
MTSMISHPYYPLLLLPLASVLIRLNRENRLIRNLLFLGIKRGFADRGGYFR